MPDSITGAFLCHAPDQPRSKSGLSDSIDSSTPRQLSLSSAATKASRSQASTNGGNGSLPIRLPGLRLHVRPLGSSHPIIFRSLRRKRARFASPSNRLGSSSIVMPIHAKPSRPFSRGPYARNKRDSSNSSFEPERGPNVGGIFLDSSLSLHAAGRYATFV